MVPRTVGCRSALNRRGGSDTCFNKDAPRGRNYAERSEPDTEGQTLCGPTHAGPPGESESQRQEAGGGPGLGEAAGSEKSPGDSGGGDGGNPVTVTGLTPLSCALRNG